MKLNRQRRAARYHRALEFAAARLAREIKQKREKGGDSWLFGAPDLEFGEVRTRARRRERHHRRQQRGKGWAA